MIRERCVLVPEEAALTTHRAWTCICCSLDFSMKTREKPEICPRCKTPYDVLKELETSTDTLHEIETKNVGR